ncbi:hypothetical protein LCGC14_1147740 [marine sediment metagenome]|uniref:SF4 helicase domain-containing protein n=1 Tax=marine sediment metagenome TaxID=412755 RepID=A0A0F9Q207_9ZZZZ
MAESGLYARAHKAIEELLPSLKGEIMGREQWWRLLNVNLNNPLHIPFKNAINEVLYQMTSVNINKKIEKNGSRFKVVDDELVPIVIGGKQGERFDLVLPFGIHEYCFMYNKNIGIIFGSKDAGKSAIIFNIARMNMNKRRVILFSSEMGTDELNGRLSKYKGLELSDWKIEAYERSYNFDEVIKEEGALYLMDFLELGGDESEYYKGVALVRRIYDRISKMGGVAFIACQKNKDALLPKGGSGLLEKARIAISLDPGKVTLAVAKNWADGVVSSPKGKIWTYKLVGGINILNPQESYGDSE